MPQHQIADKHAATSIFSPALTFRQVSYISLYLEATAEQRNSYEHCLACKAELTVRVCEADGEHFDLPGFVVSEIGCRPRPRAIAAGVRFELNRRGD